MNVQTTRNPTQWYNEYNKLPTPNVVDEQALNNLAHNPNHRSALNINAANLLSQQRKAQNTENKRQQDRIYPTKHGINDSYWSEKDTETDPTANTQANANVQPTRLITKTNAFTNTLKRHLTGLTSDLKNMNNIPGKTMLHKLSTSLSKDNRIYTFIAVLLMIVVVVLLVIYMGKQIKGGPTSGMQAPKLNGGFDELQNWKSNFPSIRYLN